MNIVWFALLAIGILFAVFTGRVDETTDAAFTSASSAVELAIGLIGVMALWLGIMRVAEKAGLLQFVARLLFPVLKRLFPGIPREHPAMGSIVSNIAANMLGLSNAATPLGLRAMKDMQELNQHKKSASNSMAMFLAINTSSVTIIPMTVINMRVEAGSLQPAEIVGTTLVATCISTLTAIIAVKLLQKYAPTQDLLETDTDPSTETGEDDNG